MSEKWIDVGTDQGIIDWKRVKAAGISGAVIKAGYGDDAAQKNKYWDRNITGALATGLKVAAYWFSYAINYDDAVAEWMACKEVIGPHKGDLQFVAFDYEYDSVQYYRRRKGTNPDKALINQMARAFLDDAKADGYRVMLYTNNDYRRNVFSAEVLAAYPLWLADYTGGPDVPCAMQQTTSTGHVDGITGNVDLDILYTAMDTSSTYSCDTSGTVEIARGAAYQAEITCGHSPAVVAGTPGIVTILPRSSAGNRWYYYIVPIGQPGQETGIYINGGQKQLTVRVKGGA